MIRHRRLSSISFSIAAVLALLVPVLKADDATQAPTSAARLSSVEGKVRISQGTQVLADPALVNAPLFTGTRVETGDDGKAEIQFDDGSVVRLAPGSALTLTTIDPQGSSVVLESGLGYFEMPAGGQGVPLHVAFADSAVTATGFTVMRIKLDNPPGELAVFSGNAHLDRGNSMSVDLHGGESVALNTTDPSHYNLADTIEPDSWDSWNSDRDQALNAEAATQTGAAANLAGNATPAWNDLDANGQWYNVPNQGYVWSPDDASDAGFDPYANGNWMATPGYGYVFVSGYPWGYLPYQCGAWNYYNGFGWGWAPGFRMGGCHPWWGGGRYPGLNIGIAPRGYRPIPRPILRGPIGVGRTTASVIPGGRTSFVSSGGLPARNHYAPVEIAGSTVMPLRPNPVQQHYQSSPSGFVYHPAGGYQGANYDRVPSNNMRTSPSGRAAYVPPPTNTYTAMPNAPRPSAVVTQPGGAGNPGSNGNFGAPVPGVPPGGRVGKPPDAHQSWSNQRTAPAQAPAPRQYTPPSAPRSYSPPPAPSRPSGGGGNFGGGGGGGGGAHPSSGAHH
jgi:hypothetical protein